MTRTVLSAATTIAAATALATPAQAGVLTKSATDCGTPELSQPFKRWLDYSQYKLVDDGTFEDGADAWTLTGGARVVAGNATQKVSGTGDARSLSLPAGSSATTPPVCVGINEPTLRYFAKSASLFGTMAVTVHVQLELGVWVTLPVGLDLGGAWHPGLPHVVVANLLPLLPPDMTAVRFTFKPLIGSFGLDDVYVDPRARF